MSGTAAIIGAGLAGAKAAETLRTEGFDGRVVLIGDEAERPYDRPSLSKKYLRGEEDIEDVYVHAADFAQRSNVELLSGARVDAIDVGASRLRIDGHPDVAFNTLLLATGSAPRRLPIPGAELPGVHVLRTLDDSQRLREALLSAAHVAVIGAGWIGCEVAASARQMGKDVTIIDPLPTPLHRVLGEEIGSAFAALHADHGAQLRLGVGVKSLVGGATVEAVVLSDGTRVEADVVVVGVGVTPRLELARTAGLGVADGVIADDRLQTTAPGIFVAGDIAEAAHPLLGTRVRVEHWANALNQGQHAARNMLGADAPYDRLPYFYSDQYDLGLEYVGYTRQWDDVVFRGDVEARKFIAFYRRGKKVVAGIAVNVWDTTDALKALITTGGQISSTMLADESIDLSTLAQHAGP